MSSYLKTKTANVATYIPDRYDEGYGVSYKGIDFADDNDFSLIVALDCGIKAIDKIDYAKEKGIDFIICDHHRPGNQVPNAVAVLDPKQEDCNYPYKELCGCGVGFKLIQAVAEKFSETLNDLIPYLDCSHSNYAELSRLHENRVLAFFGLQVINAQPRVVLSQLMRKKDELTITDLFLSSHHVLMLLVE